MKKTISFICLVLCTLIWGTTFIAQDTGMDNIGPYTFNSIRFFVGFFAVAPFVFLLEKRKINIQIKNKKEDFLKLILPVGIFLFLGCIFQQVSLLYTDVANAAFFTIFYVLMVPVIINFLFSEKLHWAIWPSVIACVVGGYFLSDISNATIRFGDTLVLIGAVFWALHIIYIGKIINKFDLPFFIAMLQNLIVATLSFILVMMLEEFEFSKIKQETTEILFTVPKGEVVEVGPGRSTEDGKSRIPMEIKKGDQVIYSKYAGTEYKEGDQEFLILRESDILAKIS